MSRLISTCNMAEALYLLRCGNRPVAVRMESTWPYGLEECAVAFEGVSVEADHERYIRQRIVVDLRTLPELFAAVSAVLPEGGNACGR
jgi:hypothetical protein